MLKNILYATPFLLFFLFVGDRITAPRLAPSTPVLHPIAPLTVAPEGVIECEKINAFNRAVTDFQADANIEFKGKRVRITAQVHHSRPRSARVLVSSALGLEADIGSDGEKFWFWSKRYERDTVFCGRIEDVERTRLKLPLNPHYLIPALGLGDIPTRNCVASKADGKILLTEDVNGRRRVTLVDVAKRTVVGHYLYGGAGRLEAFSEVTQHVLVSGYYLPQVVVMKWDGEEIDMVWTLSNHGVNVSPPAGTYTMPLKPRIYDLATDRVSLQLPGNGSNGWRGGRGRSS